ncbi:hypothetical protein FQN54_001664 [Arachnomyces sp. PD_36]|nr:hypothetical protein FQN54_001664 [Arachnomyces sp. PD_36]
MDRSLDEIIAERPQKSSSNRGRARPRRQNNWPRDGVKKVSFLFLLSSPPPSVPDWVHDKFEDDRDTRSYRGRPDRRDNARPTEPDQAGAKLRITGLHYDLGEEDLEGLFSGIGPVTSVKVIYDRAGRSEGVAFVVYRRLTDAKSAIREFDGANAKGQPIHLSLVPSGGAGGRRDDRRNPFDNVEKPKGSLFDRVERPRGRGSRSLSPEGETDISDEHANGNRGKRPNGARRSDVSKPPPEHIDRYVPGQGQRSPRRRNDGGRSRGRRPGERGEPRSRTDSAAGGRTTNGRPKKTQEELDQEMDDYWATTNTPNGNGDNNATAAPAATSAPTLTPAPPAAGDDDIDMIE